MSRRWPIHTLVFDLDDTLYLEREYALSGFRAVGDWLRQTRGLIDFEARAQRLFDEGQRGRIFDRVLSELGTDAASELVQEMVRIYREHFPRIRLLPEAEKMLDWAGRHFRTALISDGFLPAQTRKVEALQLQRWIPVIVLTDAWGREFWKPNPRAFREVMQRLPGEAPGFVYIADNPRKDFLGARAAGWRTLRIRREGTEHGGSEALPAEAADRELSSLLFLADCVDPISSPNAK